MNSENKDQKIITLWGVWCAATSNAIYRCQCISSPSIATNKNEELESTSSPITTTPTTTTIENHGTTSSSLGVLLAFNVRTNVFRGASLSESSPWGYLNDAVYVARAGGEDAIQQENIFAGDLKLVGYSTTLNKLLMHEPLETTTTSPPVTATNRRLYFDSEYLLPANMPVCIARKVVMNTATDVFIHRFYQLHHNMLALNRTDCGVLKQLKQEGRILHTTVLVDMRNLDNISKDVFHIPTILGISLPAWIQNINKDDEQRQTDHVLDDMQIPSTNDDSFIKDHPRIRLWTHEDITNLPITMNISFNLIGEWCKTTAVVRVRKLCVRRGDGRELDVTEGAASNGELFAMLDNQFAGLMIHGNYRTNMVQHMSRNDGRNISWSNSDIWTHPALVSSEPRTISTLRDYTSPPQIIIGFETHDRRIVEVEIERGAWLRTSPPITISQSSPALSPQTLTRKFQETQILIESLPPGLDTSCMVIGACALFNHATWIDYDTNTMCMYK